MIGKTISHYKVVDKLGEGGMGAVYKAEDTTLRRLVALKVLSSQLAENEEARERFVREAQAASALNHSNITTVYELLEDEGEQYIVMEYVEGKTIRDMVESGHVSIRKALDIIIQASEALEAAHNKGILHRDVKSANIMVSMEGNVKVMDFGLAHLEDRSQLTRTGTTMGTLAYSSPEQLTGALVDRRSEIFSLGVVFYELLTGQLPFRSPSEGELLFEIINNEQDRPSMMRDDIPENVEAVITKMLIKKPDQRYVSCAELLGDLNAIKGELETTTVTISPSRLPIGKFARIPATVKWISVVAIAIGFLAIILTRGRLASEPPRIAVLPFINQGPVEDEYLELGLLEEIITRMVALQGLSTIDKSSVLSYRDPDVSIELIGHELHVDFILTGTFRRQRALDDSSLVRFTPRLVRILDQAVIWSLPFDVSIESLQAASVTLAQETVAAIGIKLLAVEEKTLSEYPTENDEAYRLYLKGNDLLADRFASTDRAIEAMEYYREASRLDPEAPLILASLAGVQAWLLWQSGIPTYLPEATQAIEKAIELAPNDPAVRVMYGRYFYWGFRDFMKAQREYEKVLELHPEYPPAIKALAEVYRRQGRWNEAAGLLEKSLVLNPREFTSIGLMIDTYIIMRQWDEAEYHLERLDNLYPDRNTRHSLRARLYLNKLGDIEAAITTMEEMSVEPEDRWIGYIHRYHMASLIPDYYEGMFRRPDSFRYYLIQGRIALAQERSDHAVAYFDTARSLLNDRGPVEDIDPLFIAMNYIYSGLCNAVLGEREAAVREGMHAVDVLDIGDDAVEGIIVRERLAEIYVLVGMYDEAIEELEWLMGIPSYVSLALLPVDPRWRPLRNLPRFQELLRKYN